MKNEERNDESQTVVYLPPHRRRDAASSLPLELNSKRMIAFIVHQSLHHTLPLIRLCCLSGQPTRISYG
ncbi:hypothetical protein ACI2J4_12135 [Agrobacterium tumefaciens]|uniref:hypothetical protein n=1 Tax=Agrobacterium tumefaciens TaxID=358 RepID=UPI00384D86F2